MNDPAFENDLLRVAEQAARAAGAELIKRWGGPLTVSTKSTETDPVSEADVAAEHAIREILGRERPGDSILGEEGGATGDGELQWIVDPLDGTVNYLYGLPNFVVSVGCHDAAGGLVGVVLDPVRDVLFTATRSGSALCGEEVLTLSQVTEIGRALVGTGFGYDPAVRALQAPIAARMLPLVRDLRRIGAAALDLCYAAGGRLDAYFELGVKPWDIAAGQLICERAGLAVRVLEAVPAADGGPGLPEGILVAPPAIVDALEALILAPSLD